VRWGTSAEAGRNPRAASLRDPKDGIRLMPRINRGMSWPAPIRHRHPRPHVVLAEDPGLLMARRTIAVAYEAAGQYARAIEVLRGLEKEGQLTVEDAIVLGDNLASRTASRRRWRSSAHGAGEPEVPAAVALAGRGPHQAGRNAEAAAAYEHVLALVPDHIEALRGLGDIALLEGRLDAAAPATAASSRSTPRTRAR
jgi:tetratricopeptide (TPR) repeat protein